MNAEQIAQTISQKYIGQLQQNKAKREALMGLNQPAKIKIPMTAEEMERRIRKAYEEEDEQWLSKPRIFAIVKAADERCLFLRTLAAVAFEDGEGKWALND